MSKTDIKTLLENLDTYKEKSVDSSFRDELKITKNCFVSFGADDMTIYKIKSKAWNKKTVAGWHELTADELIEKVNSLDWEAL